MVNEALSQATGAAPRDVAGQSVRLLFKLLAANLAFNLIAVALGRPFPYTSFLFDPGDVFSDFFKAILAYPGGDLVRPSNFLGLHDQIAMAAAWQPYPGIEILSHAPINPLHMMPLTTMICLLNLAAMRALDPAAVFLGSALLLIAFALWTVMRAGNGRREALAWGAICLACYPMLMVLTRGNLNAGLTAILIIQSMLLAASGKRPVLAAILLAVACNFRPNAILFAVPLLLLTPPRLWVRIIAAMAVTGLSVLALGMTAAHAMFPDYRIGTFTGGLETYYSSYVIGDMGLAYGSSLYGGLKLLLGYHPGLDIGATLAALAVLAAAAWSHWRGAIGTTALVFITAATYCLATPVIADYHLLVFVMVPILAARDRDAGMVEQIALIAACLVLGPKNYFFDNGFSMQIALNPAILLFASVAMLAIGTRRLSGVSPDGGYWRAVRAA